MEENDIKLNVGISNYDEVYEKVHRLVELLNDADGLAKSIAETISGVDFLKVF